MTVWVPVNAEMKGFVGTLIKEASGAAKQGSKVVADEFGKGGKKAGQNLASGLTSQAALVEQATAKLTNARKVEAQAAARVQEAEQNLQILRDSGKATASQLAAATEKLNTAHNKQADAAATLARAQRDLETVQNGGVATASALARAEDLLAKAHTDANTASDRLATSMAKLEEAKQAAAQRSAAVAAAEIKLIDTRDRYGANTKETARAERELEQAKKQAATANQRVAKAEGDLKVKRAALESATDTVRAKTATYEAVQKDAARAEREVGSEAVTAGKKLRGLGDDTSSAGLSLGDFAKKAGSAMGALTGAATIGAVGSMGMEFSSNMNLVNNQLGLTGAAAEHTGASMKEALQTGVVVSSAEAAEAIGALESQWDNLGSNGAQTAGQLADNFSAFSQTFGVDMAEATQTAGQLMQNGLATDAENAADLMTAAMQRVPAQMRGELPEIINEYGTNFRALGFSGEEAFGILVSASEKGKWALDKTGDALKEFTIRGSDMSSSSVAAYDALGLSAEEMSAKIAAGGPGARDALNSVAQELLNMEDPAQRANTAIALFGTPLEDLSVDQIPQFLEGLTGADKAMEGFGGSSQALADNIANSLDGRMNRLKGTVTTLAADGFMLAWDAVSKFMDIVKFLSPVLGPVALAVFSLASGMAAFKAATAFKAVGGLVGLFTKLGSSAKIAAAGQFLLNSAMWTSPITWIVAGVVAIGAALTLFFTKTETGKKVWASLVDHFKAGINWVKDTFGPVFTEIGDKIKGTFSTIKDFVSGVFEFWKSGDTGALASALGMDENSKIVQAYATIRDFIVTTFQTISAKWQEFATGFGQAYQTWIAPVVGFVQQAFQGFGSWFTESVGKIAGVATTLLMPLFENIKASAMLWGQFLKAIFETIVVPAFQFIGTMVQSVWQNIIQPVWGFLSEAAGLLADILTGNFSNIGNRFSAMGDFLHQIVMGPINVAMDFFKNIVELVKGSFESFRAKVSGVVSSVVSYISQMVTNVQTIPEKIKAVFSAAGTWLVDAGRRIISGLWDGIQGMWDNVANWFSSLPDRIRNSIGSISFDFGGIFSGRANGSFAQYVAGGIDQLERYANGGHRENHTAQIARAGSWRVWAEPETGGEAYIPLAKSKRRRSEAILARTAEIFGYTVTDPQTGMPISNGYQGNLGPQDVRAFANGGVTGDDLDRFARGQSVNGYRARRPLQGAPYDWGGSNWGDCTGTVSAFAALALGMNPFPRKFYTGDMGAWLASRKWIRGRGKAGDFRIGFKHGGPGGGHTAATLPNGVNIEMGGWPSEGHYNTGAGAWDKYFDTFFYLPMLEKKEWNDPKVSGLSNIAQTSATATSVTASDLTMETTQSEPTRPLTPQEAAAAEWSAGMGNRSIAEIATDAIFDFFGEDSGTFKKLAFTPMDELLGVSNASTAAGRPSTSIAEQNAIAINDAAVTTMTPEELKKDPQLRNIKNPDVINQPNAPSWGPAFFAKEIARKAKSMGLDKLAAKIGIATALVESGNPLKMYANNRVPESLKYRHDALGSDYDSVGLFQQRDNGAWGTVKERMTPADSAGLFFNVLKGFNYHAMDPGAAAQKVQVSAFPDRYGQKMGAAEKLLNSTGVFDKGGLAFGRGFLHKDIIEPEAVLSPQMTPLFYRFVSFLPGLVSSFNSAGALFKEHQAAYLGGDWGYGETARYIGDDAALATVNGVGKLGTASRDLEGMRLAALDQLASAKKKTEGPVTVVINVDGQEVLRQRLGLAEERLDLNTEDIEGLKKPRRPKATALTRGGAL